jgi:hypothetical protein
MQAWLVSGHFDLMNLCPIIMPDQPLFKDSRSGII